MQRSWADVSSPYKRKCWTNLGGPLVNSLLWVLSTRLTINSWPVTRSHCRSQWQSRSHWGHYVQSSPSCQSVPCTHQFPRNREPYSDYLYLKFVPTSYPYEFKPEKLESLILRAQRRDSSCVVKTIVLVTFHPLSKAKDTFYNRSLKYFYNFLWIFW